VHAVRELTFQRFVEVPLHLLFILLEGRMTPFQSALARQDEADGPCHTAVCINGEICNTTPKRGGHKECAWLEVAQRNPYALEEFLIVAFGRGYVSA